MRESLRLAIVALALGVGLTGCLYQDLEVLEVEAFSDLSFTLRAWELSGVIWVGMRTSEQGEWFIRHTQSGPGLVPKNDPSHPSTTWGERMQNITLQIGYTRLLRPWSDL